MWTFFILPGNRYPSEQDKVTTAPELADQSGGVIICSGRVNGGHLPASIIIIIIIIMVKNSNNNNNNISN